MKHLTLITSSLLLLTSSLPAVEVVVYSPPSDKPLHVSGGGVTRTFPPSYTGHRAVCDMPGTSTNDTFVAWSGGDAYSPGDLFGTSVLRDYPTVELTRVSPVTPRIDLLTGDSDRANSIDDAYEYVRSLTGKYYDTTWIESNKIERVTLSSDDIVKIRIVSWLIDGYPLYWFPVRPSVAYSNTVVVGKNRLLTENDIITSGVFDLDQDGLYAVVTNREVIRNHDLPVTRVDYLIVVGDGDKIGWKDEEDTGVVRAFPKVITRYYEDGLANYQPTNNTPPVALSIPGSGRISLDRPVFRWTVDLSEITGYTAFRVQVLSGQAVAWDSSVRRIPAKDANGVYAFYPGPMTNTLSAGSYTWRVSCYNSKFRADKWSNAVPVTFE